VCEKSMWAYVHPVTANAQTKENSLRIDNMVKKQFQTYNSPSTTLSLRSRIGINGTGQMLTGECEAEEPTVRSFCLETLMVEHMCPLSNFG